MRVGIRSVVRRPSVRRIANVKGVRVSGPVADTGSGTARHWVSARCTGRGPCGQQSLSYPNRSVKGSCISSVTKLLIEVRIFGTEPRATIPNHRCSGKELRRVGIVPRVDRGKRLVWPCDGPGCRAYECGKVRSV